MITPCKPSLPVQVPTRRPSAFRGRPVGEELLLQLVGDRDAETLAAAEAAAVRQYCLENGVLIGVGGNSGNVLRVQPPLIISEVQLDRVFETIVEGLAATRA